MGSETEQIQKDRSKDTERGMQKNGRNEEEEEELRRNETRECQTPIMMNGSLAEKAFGEETLERCMSGI